jgi:4-hydroxy-4-methyl-2-oxoglutarate aldolase
LNAVNSLVGSSQPNFDPTRLRDRFMRLYCGVLYDAMHFDLGYAGSFVLDAAVKPAFRTPGGPVMFGHAFTCKGRQVQHESEIDDTVRIKMFADFSDGCVQVIDSGVDETVAHFGDISARIAQKFGAIGAVIDGNTRDLRFLEEFGFPVWCRAVQPVDAYGIWQIEAYQVPISLRGLRETVEVTPNDYVFADPDGVLVIPRGMAEDACAAAEQRLSRERIIRSRVRSAEDIQALYDEIGRW